MVLMYHKVDGIGVVVVGWNSIGFVDYLSILRVVFDIVYLVAALFGLHRNWGRCDNIVLLKLWAFLWVMRVTCAYAAMSHWHLLRAIGLMCQNFGGFLLPTFISFSMLAMSVRDVARIVDSEGVTSKNPFAADVVLVLKR
ncbi:hypothetical protein PIB30_096663 [Stylosanthes scabra]|uniref:Transmembrane protein n=1 Tax=Stylosanthes scabra TaxID=79078 RepID=A0ABU6SXM9_9FABA|nr:hypothetical protein [Stylosanthes scabra]